MATTLRGKDLIAIGYPEGKIIGMALNMIKLAGKRMKKEEQLAVLANVLSDPQSFVGQEHLERIAEILLYKEEVPVEVELTAGMPYSVFGSEHIDQAAFEQMNTAMRLPVTVAGALMPDAHSGYGLPIGGVLATANAIIPYAVGVDIGCRMCLSIYPESGAFLNKKRPQLLDVLKDHTRFGRSQFDDKQRDDAFLDRPELSLIPFVKNLRDKAYEQIGSSGSGNHFVDFGWVSLQENNDWGLPAGDYLGLLSHSGSRGFGATIAGHYTQLAKEKCLLPKEAQHLAWLSMDQEAGQEYWLAMNLAGDYASACHHHIHRRISNALGLEAVAMVENHHNFAWKETLADGNEYIVHRKGATPAQEGLLGIIPGSMVSPAFIVKGKGHKESLNSASHGAGRRMSRTKAKESFTESDFRKFLLQNEVDLIGGDLDESPFAYKDIHEVMNSQTALVDVIGSFLPKLVRMNDGV